MNKRLITTVAGSIATGALILFTTPAMARVDVDLNIGVPGTYVAPAPVYVQPEPVYVQPEPVYVQPRPVYRNWEYERERRWREQQWREQQWRERQAWAYRHDRDHDGVPNRYDHHPDNPYRN